MIFRGFGRYTYPLSLDLKEKTQTPQMVRLYLYKDTTISALSVFQPREIFSFMFLTTKTILTWRV